MQPFRLPRSRSLDLRHAQRSTRRQGFFSSTHDDSVHSSVDDDGRPYFFGRPSRPGGFPAMQGAPLMRPKPRYHDSDVGVDGGGAGDAISAAGGPAWPSSPHARSVAGPKSAMGSRGFVSPRPFPRKTVPSPLGGGYRNSHSDSRNSGYGHHRDRRHARGQSHHFPNARTVSVNCRRKDSFAPLLEYPVIVDVEQGMRLQDVWFQAAAQARHLQAAAFRICNEVDAANDSGGGVSFYPMESFLHEVPHFLNTLTFVVEDCTSRHRDTPRLPSLGVLLEHYRRGGSSHHRRPSRRHHRDGFNDYPGDNGFMEDGYASEMMHPENMHDQYSQYGGDEYNSGYSGVHRARPIQGLRDGLHDFARRHMDEHRSRHPRRMPRSHALGIPRSASFGAMPLPHEVGPMHEPRMMRPRPYEAMEYERMPYQAPFNVPQPMAPFMPMGREMMHGRYPMF